METGTATAKADTSVVVAATPLALTDFSGSSFTIRTATVRATLQPEVTVPIASAVAMSSLTGQPTVLLSPAAKSIPSYARTAIMSTAADIYASCTPCPSESSPVITAPAARVVPSSGFGDEVAAG